MILVDEKLGLYLDFKTYTNNEKSIYDFSSKEPNEINTLVESTTFIIRKNKSFIRVDMQSDIQRNLGEELLFKVRIRNNEIFTLENPVPNKNIPLTLDNIKNINNKIWFVLNSNNPKVENENEDYFLCENDVIRMGNIKLIVKELHIEDIREKEAKKDDNIKLNEEEENQKNENYDIDKLNENGGPIFNFFPQINKYFISEEEANKENIICFLCKEKNCSKDNPFIAFCDCNYFHFQCLKNKIKNDNITYFQNDKKIVDTYYIKRYRCETCRLVFPLSFKIEQIEQTYQLFDIVKPNDCNYMILESIEDKVYYGFLKLIYVIKLTEDNLNIGRIMNGNDIIIRDPSISKIHAEIKYDKERRKILIKNKSNKFGTSILIKNPLIIKNKKILLQNGSTLIEAKLMKVGDFEKNKNKNTKRHLPKKD